MTDEELAFKTFMSGENAFDEWLTLEQEPGGWDKQTLQLTTHFLQSYWSYKDLPNIHLFHYSDMKADLRGHIQRTADILGVSLNNQQLDEMTEAATFENMQKNGDQFAPGSGTGLWKEEKKFFATGENRQWEGKLTNDELAVFDKRIKELLSEEQAAWLVR